MFCWLLSLPCENDQLFTRKRKMVPFFSRRRQREIKDSISKYVMNVHCYSGCHGREHHQSFWLASIMHWLTVDSLGKKRIRLGFWLVFFGLNVKIKLLLSFFHCIQNGPHCLHSFYSPLTSSLLLATHSKISSILLLTNSRHSLPLIWEIKGCLHSFLSP